VHHLILVISILSLIVAVNVFVRNVEPRGEINKSLGENMPTPERRVTEGYNSDDLNQVAKHLRSHLRVDRRSLLELYIRPVLIWNDIIFAIALSAFSATLWLWIVVHFGLSGWPRNLLILLAASALLYGIFDVAEDVTLVRLLQKSDPISKSDGQIASLLTRLKFVTIVVSVTGGIVFQTLSWMTSEKPKHG
jgi:hypothetical protein